MCDMLIMTAMSLPLPGVPVIEALGGLGDRPVSANGVHQQVGQRRHPAGEYRASLLGWVTQRPV